MINKHRMLAETILLGKVAGILSFAKHLSTIWKMPLVSNIHLDVSMRGVSLIAVKNIKTLIADLEEDMPNFFDGKYSSLWESDEEEEDPAGS